MNSNPKAWTVSILAFVAVACAVALRGDHSVKPDIPLMRRGADLPACDGYIATVMSVDNQAAFPLGHFVPMRYALITEISARRSEGKLLTAFLAFSTAAAWGVTAGDVGCFDSKVHLLWLWKDSGLVTPPPSGEGPPVG